MILLQQGERSIRLLNGGRLWLDGGAMFGVVPKPLWSRFAPADEQNRIPMAMNLLLITNGDHHTLVDTGCGLGWNDRFVDQHRLEAKSAEEILAPVDLSPAQIDRVICTHLHFDHAGGNTVQDEAGEWRAAFPNAEYVIQRAEIDAARSSHPRIQAAYEARYFEPLLAEETRVRVVEGDTDLGEGVSVELTPGHTQGMQIVKIDWEGARYAFMADLVPTRAHVRDSFIMAYDLDPLTSIEQKRRVLPRAVQENWTVVLEHEVDEPVGTFVQGDKGLVFEPIAAGV